MRTLASIFPKGQRRGSKASVTLIEAYEAVFSGRGDKEQAELVLADLAHYTGYCHAPNPEMLGHADLAFEAGRRSVFGRILHFCAIPDELKADLIEAVRLEDYANSTEGADE